MSSAAYAMPKATPPSLAYRGDDAKAKRIVAGLIGDIGFEPMDAGALGAARYTERTDSRTYLG